MSEWKDVLLEELVESISETFKFNSEPVVFLNTSDILAGKILHHETSDPKILPGQAKKRIKKGDFLFSEIRPINKRYARVTFDAENYVVSTKLLVLRSKGEIEPIYLEYFLTSDETLEYLQMIAEDRSGTFPQITFDIIKRLEILLPPLEEQHAIASVLSSLDDKIDLLHRQNQTLEQMAETLFREYFVKEESELIPLGECIKTTSGGTPSRKRMDFFDGGIYQWVKSKELNGGYILDTEEKITVEALKKSSAKLLPENSILIAMYGATVGQFAIIGQEATCNQAICACLPNNEFPYTFIYHTIKANVDELKSRAVGSAQQNISQVLIKSLEISVNTNINKFHLKVDPIMKKIKANFTQIRTLTSLRDTLLPKLMSGEVRVEV